MSESLPGCPDQQHRNCAAVERLQRHPGRSGDADQGRHQHRPGAGEESRRHRRNPRHPQDRPILPPPIAQLSQETAHHPRKATQTEER